MRTTLLIILFLLTQTLFCQNNFIGKYTDIYRDDTIPGQHSEAVYYTTINIQKNNKFTYCYQLNATVPRKELQEKVIGSWKLSGDTIIFNPQSEQKKPQTTYLETSKKDVITIIAKDSKGHQVKMTAIAADSLSEDGKTSFYHKPYEQINNKEIIIRHPVYTAIHFRPVGYCKDFTGCEITISLEGIKKGTLIVITYSNNAIENKINNTKYILRGDFLHELPRTKDKPDSWTNNFKKITLPNTR